MTLTVRGTILQTPTPDRLEVLNDHIVSVADDGTIESIMPAAEAPVGDVDCDVVLPESTYLLPGLIDLHIHAPQWPQAGTGYDLPLDQWLFEYTFPLEAKYGDESFAREVWDDLVPTLLANGTTTAVYYGSVHEPATLSLAAACQRFGQRAFVGRVAMDHPTGTPDWYRDADASAGVAASARSIDAINALAGADGLVRPMVTPRFIPACSDALLEGLGELAAASGALVQTHCSENDWEHDYVLDRFGITDTIALQNFGLLRPNAVLAHGPRLTEDDQRVIAQAGSGVAHCPLSNVYFGNSVLPVRSLLGKAVPLGLGSDLAGGSEPNMLTQCAHAVNASRYLEDGVDPNVAADRRGVSDARISIVEAFWLATRGGADVLGIPAGYLAPGRVFDAIAVGTGAGHSVRVWEDIDDEARVFEKLVRRASAADISSVWVNGVARR